MAADDTTETLRRQLALIRLVVDKVSGMLAYWDTNQRCQFANAAYERWFGIKHEALLGQSMEELLGPIYSLNLPYIEAALRGEEQHFEREIPDPLGGPPRFSQASYIPDIQDGVVRGIIVMGSDITARRQLEVDLRQAQERAESVAMHDYLTGLPNRALIEVRLQHTLDAARKNARRLCVLFLDIDDFKGVNDTLGHAAGDAVLCEVAQRLLGALRSTDTVARVGGDEFLVLLPEIDGRPSAAKVAQNLLFAMAQNPFLVCDQSLRVSFSVGIALFPDDGATLRELLVNADTALYSAKRRGKNDYAFPPPR